MFNKSLVICAVLTVFLVGCKKENGKVLAKVGKSVLTEEQFYSLIPPEYAASLGVDQKKELVKMWINTELLYQGAVKSKLNKEADVKLKLVTLQKQMLANDYLEKYLSKISGITEQDVKKYFDERKDYYNTEREIAQIIVRDEAEVNKIMSQLKEGFDFSKLAKEYSIDSSSAVNGGVIGYIRAGDLSIPELEEALFSLKEIGAVSAPTRTMYGYHIMKLLGTRPVKDGEVTYEKMREKIHNALTVPRKNAAIDSLLLGLRKDVKVEENYDLLK
jgi:parvulin-like peptidyl-prolyl isomerase